MTSSDLAAFGDVGRTLTRIVASGRVSPSYLFEGSDSQAVREAALAFAALLLGGDASLEHPDLHVLGKDKPTVISVDALSAELERAYQKPIEGDRQVFLVDPADAMDPAGIARYLKALEEPPPGTVYLLVSTCPERLPATVLSRVRRVRLPPLSEDAIRDRLVEEGVEADAAQRVAHWGGGSLARARRVATYDLGEVAHHLVRASRGDGGAAETTDHALGALDRAASERAEAEGTSVAEMRRQYVRDLLADVIHVLAVEARDSAAGRGGALLPSATPASSLRLLEDLGRLGAAVASNVAPAVVLLDFVRVLARVS